MFINYNKILYFYKIIYFLPILNPKENPLLFPRLEKKPLFWLENKLPEPPANPELLLLNKELELLNILLNWLFPLFPVPNKELFAGGLLVNKLLPFCWGDISILFVEVAFASKKNGLFWLLVLKMLLLVLGTELKILALVLFESLTFFGVKFFALK